MYGGYDNGSTVADFQETTRNAYFVPKSSPTILIPARGGGLYFVTANGRVGNLILYDTYWSGF
jgi:hypothetical protein